MNGELVHDQPAGAQWGPMVVAMLHEGEQPGFADSKHQQRSIFEDLERQMAQQEIEFAASLTELKKHFVFAELHIVEMFLKTHRVLISILLEGTLYMKASFGSDAPLQLEVMCDDGPPSAIYALVIWQGERVEARAALTKFDDMWWLANLKKAGGRIVFDYELV